jgi:hypothetical protein
MKEGKFVFKWAKKCEEEKLGRKESESYEK